MDTKSSVAIICAVIAIIILLFLAIYTLVTAWRKISKEHAERQHSPTAAAYSFENTISIKTEYTTNHNFTKDMTGGTSNECEEIASDRCQTAESNERMEMASKRGGQLTGDSVMVHAETNDTSF